MRSRNLPLSTERGGRIFPAGGRALDVVRVCNNWLKGLGVSVRLAAPVTEIVVRDGRICGVRCGDEILACANVILATGGKSYPRTGSSGDGYRLAEALGHTIVPLRPALVPLVCNDPQIHRMAGLELRNILVRLYVDGKRKGQEFGELTFTGFGISGPVILSLSGTVVDALDRGRQVTLGSRPKTGPGRGQARCSPPPRSDRARRRTNLRYTSRPSAPRDDPPLHQGL